jgi:small subunit ribosomal protein S13
MAEKQQSKHLVRIAQTDLDGSRPLSQALLRIKGVGVQFANMLCALTGIGKSQETGLLNAAQIETINECLKDPKSLGAPDWMLNRQRDPTNNETKHLLLSDLQLAEDADKKRLQKIRSYRGIRHASKLPVRGQRTRSNFRKNKGKVRLGVQRKK